MSDTTRRTPSTTTKQPPRPPEPRAAAPADPAEPAEPGPESSEAHLSGPIVRFGREHPVLTIAGLAGVGLLGGVPMLAGVLLGAGVASWSRRRGEPDMAEPDGEARRRLRQALDRSLRDLGARARAIVLAARGKLTPEGERVEPAPKPGDGAPQGAG